MRQPIRKASKYTFKDTDYHLTAARFQELKKRLDYWVNVKRPQEAAEVARLALMGDFSENAGYQLAKGRLRGLNQRILDLENLLNKAEIIEPQSFSQVDLGHTVTLSNGLKERTFTILGSSESNPTQGIISHRSPLGAAILGKQVGDEIEWVRPQGAEKWRIIAIN